MDIIRERLKHPDGDILPVAARPWSGRASANGLCLLLFFLLLPVLSLRAAEELGDVSISAAAMFTGNTFHGYSEIRVTLENRSHLKPHLVTLTFPNRPYNNGNSLGRLARSVKLEPEARAVVSLLQPPLPANGDGQIRVEVDGRHEGEIRAPNANNHCNFNSRGGRMATVFVSRSLDYDAMERVFHANQGGFTAAMATGAPDAPGTGQRPESWMPDARYHRVASWLELDYDTPQPVTRISIHKTQSPPGIGQITLIGVSGTNLVRVPMSPGRTSYTSRGWIDEYDFAPAGEPVKSVRLDFGGAASPLPGIDAVEITGPTGSQWASAARASSDNSAAAARYTSGRANTDSVESLRAESPVSDWSENWLAYTPFDAVVLNAADMNALPSAVLAALGDYLSAGGNVVLSGKIELPAAWHSWQKQNLRDGTAYEIGFGRCFVFNSDTPAILDPNSIQFLRATVRDTARYWQILPADSGAANAAMPVVENIKIPTRGIVVVMVAFIIVIGPINIYVLNRRQRRTWMLWTIPAISFATTLIVFAYSLLREGITPDTRIAGLTVIDQASHHATTIGAMAFYCPLTPSGGLHFDYETETTPLVSCGNGPGTSREVDWTQSQHLQRGWVSARVPAHFHLRKSETRRERLQIINENGKLQVVNGLGAPIKSLWLADENMNVYQAASVAAGQKAGLILSPQSQSAAGSGPNGLLREITYVTRTNALAGTAVKFLTPNSYLAVLDGNPFIENALGSASSPKRMKSSAVVFGILEAPPAQ